MAIDTSALTARVDAAVVEKKLTESAATNIRAWLTEPRYAEYASQVAAHITGGIL